MVLIGPNGSGKTAFLEVLTLLRDAADERLGEGLRNRGGISDVLFARAADTLTIRVMAAAETAPELQYTLEIARLGIAYSINKEFLTQERSQQPDPLFHIQNVSGTCRYFDTKSGRLETAPYEEYREIETALSQLRRISPEASRFRRTLRETRLYHSLDVSKRAVVRLPQELRPVSLPGPNGEDLYAALYNLRTSDEGTFERVQEALRAAFPGFRKLEFPLVGSGQATLAWHQDGFDKPFYPQQLSEGMLRFLWLATILLSPDIPAITLIDEPEVSLHPELLKILAGLIREAAGRTQLIVATHADRLVRWLSPDEVIVVDKDEEGTRLTWANRLNLGEWLKKYTLDELWLMGELGGRP